VAERTRTYSWDDPLAALARAADMSGLEALQLIATGELPPPPIAQTLGFGKIEVEEGKATFTIEPAEFHYNPIGVVHGGLALALLDSAMGCAVQSTLAVGAAYTTLEVKANFVRPLTSSTGPVRCTGTLVHLGRTVATAEGRVVDAAGKLYAHGTSTLLILGS
jgi:uncharacterized protein (TIGR00369 family)